MLCMYGGMLISPSEWWPHRLQQRVVSGVCDIYHVGLCVSVDDNRVPCAIGPPASTH